MTRAEQLSVGVTSALALAAAAAYAIDAAGGGLAPIPVLVLTVAGASTLAWFVRPTRFSYGERLAWAGSVAFVFAAIVGVAWPALVPPGRGPDLAHHLLLVDYIEQHQQLVRDLSLEGAMGEMAHYTPGAHVLAVLFGSWLAVDALRAFFLLLTLCTALTAGFVFLIARRLMLPLPYAIAAVMLLFLAPQYFYGAFTHDSFLAQTVATLFAVAGWWALIVWDEMRSTISSVIVSIFLVAVFLTWPMFVGPLVLVFLGLSWRRWRLLMIGLGPLLIIAAIHMVGRFGWLGMVRTSGAVSGPGLDSVGWLLPLLTLFGLMVSAKDRRARVTVVFLLAIALQAVSLFAIATSHGADTPYMAFKMMYLAIYPAAVLAAVAIASPERAMLARRREHGESKGALGWIIAATLLLVAVRPAMTAPRTIPIIDLDFYAAGKWTRANIGQTCVDYLVADAETAYWLHLAVLGNPRASPRMVEIDRYEPRAAVAPWITAEGRNYAIADLRLLPDEVRSRVEIVRTFGNAALIKRADVMMGDCDLGR